MPPAGEAIRVIIPEVLHAGPAGSISAGVNVISLIVIVTAVSHPPVVL